MLKFSLTLQQSFFTWIFVCQKRDVFAGSKHKLWHLDPPQKHLTCYITGGLKKLYIRLKDDSLDVSKYSTGHFTDKNGHFVLKCSCIMASRYRINSVINTSGQSAVLLTAEDMFKDDEVVVIKVLHRSFSQLGVQETHCLQQLRTADPDNISHTLKLLNVFTFDSHYCMVFEALFPEPITNIFQDIPRDKLIPSIKKIAMRLLAILGFLHEQNVIHADLKPENILVKRKNDLGSLKIIDFGNAIHHIHREVSLYYDDFEVQTPLYRAPEIMFGIPFGSEIDMWSVGCILAELYLGKPLFYGSDDCSILKKMTSTISPLPEHIFQRGKFYSKLKEYTGAPSDDSNVAAALMQHMKCRDYKFCSFLAGCLQYNPDKRFRPHEAALHPFVASELPIGYLLRTPDVEKVYPSVFVPQYRNKPAVASDIQRSQPSSLDLLKLGTSVNNLHQNLSCPVVKVDPFTDDRNSDESNGSKQIFEYRVKLQNESKKTIVPSVYEEIKCSNLITRQSKLGLQEITGQQFQQNDASWCEYSEVPKCYSSSQKKRSVEICRISEKIDDLEQRSHASPFDGDRRKLESAISNTLPEPKSQKRPSFPKIHVSRRQTGSLTDNDHNNDILVPDAISSLETIHNLQDRSNYLSITVRSNQDIKDEKQKKKHYKAHTKITSLPQSIGRGAMNRITHKRQKYLQHIPQCEKKIKIDKESIGNNHVHEHLTETTQECEEGADLSADIPVYRWNKNELNSLVNTGGPMQYDSHGKKGDCGTHSDEIYGIDGDCEKGDRIIKNHPEHSSQNGNFNLNEKEQEHNRPGTLHMKKRSCHTRNENSSELIFFKKSCRKLLKNDSELHGSLENVLKPSSLRAQHCDVKIGEENKDLIDIDSHNLNSIDANARKKYKFKDLDKQKYSSKDRERSVRGKRRTMKKTTSGKLKSSIRQLNSGILLSKDGENVKKTFHRDLWKLETSFEESTRNSNEASHEKTDCIEVPSVFHITPDKKIAAINAKRMEKKLMNRGDLTAKKGRACLSQKQSADTIEHNNSMEVEKMRISPCIHLKDTVPKLYRKSSTFDLDMSPDRTCLMKSNKTGAKKMFSLKNCSKSQNEQQNVDQLSSSFRINRLSPRGSSREKVEKFSQEYLSNQNHRPSLSSPGNKVYHYKKNILHNIRTDDRIYQRFNSALTRDMGRIQSPNHNDVSLMYEDETEVSDTDAAQNSDEEVVLLAV